MKLTVCKKVDYAFLCEEKTSILHICINSHSMIHSIIKVHQSKYIEYFVFLFALTSCLSRLIISFHVRNN